MSQVPQQFVHDSIPMHQSNGLHHGVMVQKAQENNLVHKAAVLMHDIVASN
jgi:hypothetical protein